MRWRVFPGNTKPENALHSKAKALKMKHWETIFAAGHATRQSGRQRLHALFRLGNNQAVYASFGFEGSKTYRA